MELKYYNLSNNCLDINAGIKEVNMETENKITFIIMFNELFY